MKQLFIFIIFTLLLFSCNRSEKLNTDEESKYTPPPKYNVQVGQINHDNNTITYKNNEIGFSFSFPDFIAFSDYGGSFGGVDFMLYVGACKISEIIPYGRESPEYAMEEKDRLSRNEPGHGAKFSTQPMIYHINNSDVNGQFYSLLTGFGFEVNFERYFVFYYKDYEIQLSLTCLRSDLIAIEMPSYFQKSESGSIGWTYKERIDPNTQSKTIYDVGYDFLNKALENKTGNGIAQSWYNLFEDIIGSLKLY